MTQTLAELASQLIAAHDGSALPVATYPLNLLPAIEAGFI